jgi:hypothetical protein
MAAQHLRLSGNTSTGPSGKAAYSLDARSFSVMVAPESSPVRRNNGDMR